MPLSVLRDGWDDLPRYPPAFDQMVPCYIHPLPVSQGSERESTQENAWNQLSHGLVSLPPHSSCGGASDRANIAWHGRNGRNLCRRKTAQGKGLEHSRQQQRNRDWVAAARRRIAVLPC